MLRALDDGGNVLPPVRGPRLDGSIVDTRAVQDTDGGRLDGDALYDRAMGPFEFIPETWKRYGVDANGDGVASPDNIDDASLAAGRYLCADGRNLATGEGWAYLCTIRDGHTRRVLGRTVADHLRADLVEDALRQAVALRGHLPGNVIFHADRGCQYTSEQIAKAAGELGLLRSMGRTGVCWDNAAAESFWSTFKNEYYHRHVFPTIAAARQGAYTWIDSWYNARRRHSAIGYISPLQYEHHLARQANQTAPKAA